MHGWVPVAVVIAVLLSGCTGEDTPPAPALDDQNDASPTDAVVPNGTEAPASVPPAPVPASASLDGRLEYGARVCQPSTGTCQVARPVADDQELYLPLVPGTLASGNATLTWTPTSELTNELRLTVWYVPACEGCALVDIGTVIGPGPITVPLGPGLAVDGGAIWAYARAPYSHMAADVYVQYDFQQTFQLAEDALVQPAADA